ncbi:hypothetical protein [uncultured Paraglaciecola sp.]|uniref:hypothetical protein n=1 Tax=uncultured Paraglaciecola sp. TaxID=1765024 RepID=UPI0026065EB8|nr:hypothetical protein [uncultured Paraglaciecola sp.]
MFNWRIVSVCLLFLSGGSVSTERTDAKPLFRISYGGSIEGKVYAQFVQSIYQELGFTVSILTTPTKRGLILLNDSLVDADVIRLKSVATKYDNVILVEPAFAKGSLVLLCKKGEPCNLEILQQETAYIQTDEGTLKLFEKGDITAHIVISEMPTNTLKMLEEDRIIYALYSFDASQLSEWSSKLNYIKVKDVSGYHVINKKHLNLLPQIQQKFREKLPAFNASRNQLPL